LADITKTVGTSVISLQSNAASTVLVSSVISFANKLAATLFIHFGRRAATAAGAGVNIRVEASSKASLDGHWYPVAIFTTAFAAAEGEAVTGTVASGQKVITCASTTNLAAGDIIYIDNGTIANSEWHRIKSISANVSVTIEDNLLNAQTSATMYDTAEMYVCQLDLTAISRLRVVIDGSLFTQACAIEIDMVSGDSIS
jgi:hypothetical protein